MPNTINQNTASATSIKKNRNETRNGRSQTNAVIRESEETMTENTQSEWMPSPELRKDWMSPPQITIVATEVMDCRMRAKCRRITAGRPPGR